MRSRLAKLIIPVLIIAAVVVFADYNRFGRLDATEPAEAAWRRAHRAMIEGDYGTVYDSLSVEAQREADAMFGPELAKEADR